jgi:hypothetical protein
MDRPASSKMIYWACYERNDGKPGYTFRCDCWGNPDPESKKALAEFFICTRGFDVDGTPLNGPYIKQDTVCDHG